MFALRRHKIEFQGRQLRIFPSTENPHLGQLKSVKKGKPVAYAFSGITSKKSTRYDCRGKKCNRGPAKSYANNKKQSIRSSRVQKNGNKKLKSSWNEKGTERVPRSNNIRKKKYATL